LRRLANRCNFAVSLRWLIIGFSTGLLEERDEDLLAHGLHLEKKKRDAIYSDLLPRRDNLSEKVQSCQGG
jgi:hypothetical protein